MSEIIPQDTPIQRASILTMDDAQLSEYIQTLQTRRLASYHQYQAGVTAKENAKDDKTRAQLEKRLEQLAKALERAEKALETCDKYSIEVQAYRLALGDVI